MDFPPIAPDRFSGRKLGKYEVVCRLSTGGMAEIFLAFHRGVAGFRKLVVLKRIIPDINADEDIVRMFLDEAKITGQFNHPNIAQVYDLDVSDGELFLAMEFIPGATLIEVAQAARKVDEAIPVGFTLAAVRDTALGLHYAHTFKDPLGRPRPVIHRDVAEKNVMVTYDGTTKLLDFGIAKARDRITRTAVGKVKGTSGYMSPEQVVGDELDARSDVFSLGIVLHECLTGLRLFYGKDAEQGMLAALNQTPVPPSKHNAEIGPELDAVALKSLERDRGRRYSTALEFARALERAAGPQFWHPEQSAELVLRLFSDRRAQTQQLLEGMADRTGEIDLNVLLRREDRPAARPPAPPARPTPGPPSQPRAHAPVLPPPAIDRRTTEPTKQGVPGQSPVDAAALELLREVAAPVQAAASAQLSKLPRPSEGLRGDPSVLMPMPSKNPSPRAVADEATIIKPPRQLPDVDVTGPTFRPPPEDDGEATVQGAAFQERTADLSAPDLSPPPRGRPAKPPRGPSRSQQRRWAAYYAASILVTAAILATVAYLMLRV